MTTSTTLRERVAKLGELIATGIILTIFLGGCAALFAAAGYVLSMLMAIPGFGVTLGATIGVVYAIREIRQLEW